MKKYLVAAVVALVVFGFSAFAASLRVDAGTLQAGQDAIDSCIAGPDAVKVTYGTPAFDDGEWVVSQVTLDHEGKCTTLAFSVVVTGANGLETSPITGTFTGEATTVTFNPPFDAENASDVHLVIHSANS